MNVWVALQYWIVEPVMILGVFSNKESAMNACRDKHLQTSASDETLEWSDSKNGCYSQEFFGEYEYNVVAYKLRD